MFNSSVSWRRYFGSALVLGGLILVLALVATSPSGIRAQENRGNPRLPERVAGPTNAEGRGPVVYAPEALAFGKTYAEWSAAWWQWAFSIPVADNPLFDNGECNVGQSGPVWFLGGKFCQVGSPDCSGTANRTCAIPAGKGIYFPVYNVEDSAPEEPDYACGDMFPPLLHGTIAEMRQCDAYWVDQMTDVSATIDGAPIHNLKNRFRVQSVVFGATLPEDNILKGIGEPIGPGTYFPVMDDGYYVMLAPLSPGPHVLHIQAGTWENVTYYLSVGN